MKQLDATTALPTWTAVRAAVAWIAAGLLFAWAAPGLGQCAPCPKASFGPATSALPASYPSGFADFDGDGHLDMFVRADSKVSLYKGTGTGRFGPELIAFQPVLDFGDTISGVVAGDFNGDGHLDLAVSHRGYIGAGGLWFVPGNGAGGFGSAVPTPGGRPAALVAADFDGDGKLDLAVSSWEDAGATVLFGNGDGTFGASVFLPLHYLGTSLAAADFDGDGKPDLSVNRPTYTDPSGALVFLHTGARSFAAPLFLPAPGAYSQSVADLDRDGHPDLLIQGVVYLSRGGSFEAPLGANAFPDGILGDFDGDGVVDLAAGAATGFGIGIDFYPGDGFGSFGPPIRSSGLSPGILFAIDLNEDGALDLIGSGAMAAGRGDGTFELTPAIPLPPAPMELARADFTGDGIPDIVLLGNGITIVPGLPGGLFGSPASVSQTAAYSMAVADFNRDGRPDLATATVAGIEIRLGLPGGGLSGPSILAAGWVSSLVAGDIQGDDKPDLAFVLNQRVGVVLGNGDGTFGSTISPLPTFQAEKLRLADMNGDGKADLVLYGSGGLATYLGDGNGSFSVKTIWLIPVNDVVIADVNGDSRPDVIAPAYLALRVFLNDGSGGLASPADVAVAGSPERMVGADFNGDGAIDIAIQSNGHVVVLTGDGAGHFAGSSDYALTAGPMLAGDLDGDGKADLFGTGGYPSYPLWSLHNTNCVARRLPLTTNVGSCGPAGTPFSPQPALSVFDDAGNLVACPGTSISASIVPGTGTPGATLSGTTVVPVSGGSAAFTNLAIGVPGAGYRLRFTHTSGAKAESHGVSVAPAPPAITVTGACTVGAVRLETPAGAEAYRWKIDGAVVGTLPSITVSGLAAGPHALALDVTRDGCATTAAQTLTIAASPAAPAASSNSPVSFGGTLELSASPVAGGSYQWTGPGGFASTQRNPSIANVTPAFSGLYRVTVRVGACSSAEATVAVTVLPAPLCSGCAAPSFGPATRAFPAGGPAVVAGDFNGDGITDFAVGGVKVLLGTGTGEFGAPFQTAVPPELQYSIRDLLAEDWDRDGFLDILARGDSGFAVLLGRGDGSFASGVLYPVANLVGVAVGDFNEDGWPDVAAAKRDPNQVLVYYGTGTGALTPGPSYALTGYPNAIVSGVFRPGGHKDLVIGQTSPHSLVTLLGAGNGTFAAGPVLTLSDAPFSLAVGDLDGDGALDVAAASNGFTSWQLFLCRGNSDGSFTLHESLPVAASRPRIVDLDKDGHSDLVFLGSGGLDVLFGTGGWHFEPIRYFSLGGSGQNFDVADFDGDGFPEAAVASSDWVEVLRGGPDGFEVSPTAPTAEEPGTVLAADFTGDSRPDLAVLDNSFYYSRPISILVNDGLGGFPSTVFLPGTDSASAFAAAMLDGDGRADLVVSCAAGTLVFHGSPSGPPALHQTISALYPTAVAIADFNKDGKPDLAGAVSAEVRILSGDGAGGFSTVLSTIALAGISRLQAGDFNGDGKPDLLLYDGYHSTLYAALGTGDGTFGAPAVVAYKNAEVADYDGDGKDDLLADDLAGIVVMLSNGGGFDPPATIVPNRRFSAIAYADVNGDGRKDLVTSSGPFVTVLVADGNGAFVAGRDLVAGEGSLSVAVSDLDGDGRPDIAVTNFSEDNVTILFNTRCVPRRLGVAVAASGCTPPGSPLATQPVVKILDDGGNVVACEGGAVTASLLPGVGTPGAVLGGTKEISPVNGVAAFSNLSVDRAGAYQLEFHHPALLPARSPRFAVGAPPAPPVPGNNGPICLGQTLQLTASLVPGAKYQWTGPNGFHSTLRNPAIPDAPAAAAGVYSVVITVDGCSSAAATTSVTVNPIPEVKMTVPASACPNGRGLTASVAQIAGATYAWTITNGTITGGAGTDAVTFTAGMSGTVQLSVTVTGPNGCGSTASKSVPINPDGCGRSFFTVTPCRVVDTRLPNGQWGGPALSAGGVRTFSMAGSCGISAAAKAVAVNLTVVEPSNDGDLRVYPYATVAPLASSINFRANLARANNAVISLSFGSLSVQCDMPSGGTHFVIDVYGYFE